MRSIAETIRAMRTCLDNVAFLRDNNAPADLIAIYERQAREYEYALDRLLVCKR